MTERELFRNAARRLAIIWHAQEVTGNVALTCRSYGITRQAYYKWLRRYEELGVAGLRERSSRPHATRLVFPVLMIPTWMTPGPDTSAGWLPHLAGGQFVQRSGLQ